MSIPNPIYVSPSTTQLQINPLQTPYTPVLLNQVQYPGQVVTILDGTSSLGALTSPIVVSTLQNNTFLDGSISTLINQPQGFITAQTYSTNKWAFLNSFPFRNQYLSAGLMNLTTSTLFTALTSTLYENVGSLSVENLRITGNFVQSQGITLNTNVSTLGSVEILSSLTIFGNTYLSSALNTIGAVKLYSSLEVYGDFVTNSSIITNSSMYISGSLIALGFLSTPSIELQDGLVGTKIDVAASANIAGSILIEDTFSTNSSIFLGGFLSSSNTQAYSADFLSSAGLYQEALVTNKTSTLQTFTTTGSLGVGRSLNVGLDLNVNDNILVYGNGYIKDIFTIGSTLITSTLRVGILEAQGDYINPSTITSVESVNVDTNYGGDYISSASTSVSGIVTIFGSLMAGNTNIKAYLDIPTGISSLANVSSGQNFFIEGSLSSFGFTRVSSMSTVGNLEVGKSTITSLLNGTTTIAQNLLGLGDLDCSGTLTISSIALPSSLIANNFVAGTAYIGTYGIVDGINITNFVASSATFGYIQNSEYPFDLSGNLFINQTNINKASLLSTGLISTTTYIIAPNSYGSYIYVESTMAVNTSLQDNAFVCQPLGYFLSSPMRILENVSSGFVLANVLDGTFIGDGSQLSNFSYPIQISVNTLRIDGVLAEPLEKVVPGIFTSSLQVGEIGSKTVFINSTMNIGEFELRGVQTDLEFNTAKNLLQTSTPTLLINDVQFIGNSIGSLPARVGINLHNSIDASYEVTLGVYSTLAVDALPGDFLLNAKSFHGDKVVVLSNFSGLLDPSSQYPIGNLYLSSGTISSGTEPFFLGENQEYDSRFNIIQPYQSTLQFNSTLFVNREFGRVGINTQPNFNLDAESIFVGPTTYGVASNFVKNQINLNTNLSTLYYAFVNSNATYSNTLFADSSAEGWKNFFADRNYYIFKNSFTPGYSLFSNLSGPNYPYYEKTLLQLYMGSGTGQFFGNALGEIVFNQSFNGTLDFNTPANAWYTQVPPDIFWSIASDITNYIACGTISPTNLNGSINTLFSFAGNFADFQWNPVDSNVFPAWTGGISYTRGGYSIVYGGANAPVWISVGVGSTGPIWRSLDRTTWTLVDIGSPYYELYSVISTELPYNGGTVFLTGGAYLSAAGTTFVPLNGFVFASTDLGETWTLTGSNFTGPVKQVATNGKVVVAAVNATVTNYTLWYSLLTSSNTYNWVRCTGSVFANRANSVIWSGSNFVAGGDTGIRTSIDGFVWTNPETLSYEVNNLAYTSNAATSIQVADFDAGKFLLFQDSPNLQSQRLIPVPTISYYPSPVPSVPHGILNLNNACICDEVANVIALGAINNPSPLRSIYTSTFYASDAYIANSLSTPSIVLGAYRLGIQSA